MAPNQAILANCHSDQQESSLQRPCSSWSGERRQEWGRGVPDSHFNQATLIQRRSGYSLAQSQAGEVTFCPEDPQLVWGSG